LALYGKIIAMLALCGLVCSPAIAQERGPMVLAAASLQEALTEAAALWTARKHARPVLSFAGSSALARQIEAGAPADIFLSADIEWMDYVAKKGLLRAGTRSSLLSNRMVLIAPLGSKGNLVIGRNFPLERALGNGRLAMADPGAVPAGKYGKAALSSLGVWPMVQGKIARVESVRAALALVERGEAPLGIVYATDARVSLRVRVLGVFPAQTHPPITYPIAVLKASSHPETVAFVSFLRSRDAMTIFARRGFIATRSGARR
jgi:molybdate transport system substrate-binding protein